MSEYFELTFYSKKSGIDRNKIYTKLIKLFSLHEGFSSPALRSSKAIDKPKYSLFLQRNAFLDIFEESDFLEYRICLENLIFTKMNINELLLEILEVVNICFLDFPSFIFATGIYELTYFIIENIHYIDEFNNSIFKKFPFAFFRENNLTIENLYPYKGIYYLFNPETTIQNIFSNKE